MKLKTKLLLLAAFFVLALPLIITGTASAKYMSDGAVQNGTSLKAPTDGICVLSLKSDGTMAVDTSITNKRDCDANLIAVTANTSDDTLANVCGNPAKNAAGLKYAAPGSNNCVTIDINGYITGGLSMVNLDRGAIMCSTKGGQLGNATATTLANGYVINTATKNTANGTAAMCAPYGWQYRAQDGSGTPLTFGSTGVTPAASGTGFCYTSVRTGITAATCPSTLVGTDLATLNAKYGYSVSGTNCLYAYGTSGVANGTLTNIDGTVYAAAGSTIDLRTLTQGECLANGASWANGWGFVTTGNDPSTADGWTSGTGVKFDQSRQALNSDEGCLHCHSYTSQQNGPAERFKDSYIKTGHRNMLRKVTPGMPWSGPDGVDYATTGYAAGSINWGTLGVPGSATATVSGTPQPLLYIFGDWMAAAPGGLDVIVNMSGAAKYNGTTDYSCAACHTTGWGNTSATAGICSLSSKTTQALCTGAGGTWYPISGVESIGITSYTYQEPGNSFPGITFGSAATWDLDGIQCGRCHNATVPAITQAQINASAFPNTYPTNTGMGNIPGGPAAFTYSTGLCYGCHQGIAKTVNGTGADNDLSSATILPVKNNVTAPAYQPEFSGHVIGGEFLGSVHARYTGAIQPNSLGKYDLSAGGTYASTFQGYTCWQSPSSNSPAKTKADGTEIKTKTECESLYGAGSWRSDTRGGCSSCHDVHNSLFVEGQEGLRKECEDCHENNSITGATVSSAPQVDLSVIKHPTTAGTPFDTNLYVNACEICHMPKATSGGFPIHLWRINTDKNYSTFPTALEFGIGGTATKKIANTAPDGSYANAVWVDLDLACGQCHGGSAGTNATKNGAPYMDKTYLSVVANNMHLVSAASAPVAAFAPFGTNPGDSSVVLYNVSLHDTSTNASAITVNWGDGHSSNGNAGDTLTHTYATAGTFNILLTASAGGVYDSTSTSVSVPQKFDITINLVQADLVTPDPLPSGATFVLRKNGATVRAGKDTQTETFSNLKPGTYKLKVHKTGYTFDCNSSGNPLFITVGSSNQTVTCTHTP